MGKSGYKDLPETNLINFNYQKWIELLERGQGHLKNIFPSIPDVPIATISWNSENINNEGTFCIKIFYENGTSSFMKLGKEIHRFKKEKIDEELHFFNEDLRKSKEMHDPVSMIVESKMVGGYNLLNKLKSPDQTITCVAYFEKALYSNQYEENVEEYDNDYTPLGLILYSDSSEIVKIENLIPLLSRPSEFEKYYANWNSAGANLDKCALKIIVSDSELDSYLQTFFIEKVMPVIDPLFNADDHKLSSGLLIDSMKNLIEQAKRKQTTWKRGDNVEVVFPKVKTDKHAKGILLTDEFIDETGVSCIIFQPVEDGKILDDLQYKMPTDLLRRLE